MQPELVALVSRVERLERGMRRARFLASTTGIALLATWVAGAGQGPAQIQEMVRTRHLVVQDSLGRDRIVLGAPMPDARRYVGMKILGPDGAEQFGLGLKVDGSVSMGFDVQPGVGDPRNRERLNMGVTSAGTGWIRYLDNQTRARLFLQLDPQGKPVLQFLDWLGDQRIMVRQLGFAQDTVIEWKR